jgi:hypothetical protein
VTIETCEFTFGPEHALSLAREAGRRLGLDVSGARLLRARSSAHVELPEASVIARVEPPGAEELAERQVTVGRCLMAANAPVPWLEQPEKQPITLGGGAVVLWQRVESVGAPDPETVGRAIKRIHDSAPGKPAADFPRIDPLTRTRASLAKVSAWTGTPEWNALDRLTEECEASWASLVAADPLGQVLVHGDVHLDNALQTSEGSIMVDLEDAGLGPASWDFVPLAVGVRRYGLATAVYESFISGYGASPTLGEGLDTLCTIYELLVTSWAMECSHNSPEMATEAALRVATLLGTGNERWSQC